MNSLKLTMAGLTSRVDGFTLKAISSIGLRFFSALIGVLASILIARWLGPSDFGRYSFLVSLATLIGVPLNAGLPTLLIRETARLDSTGDYGGLRGLLLFAMSILSCFLLVGILAYVLYRILPFGSSEIGHYALVIALLVPLLGLDKLRGAIMQGMGSAVMAQIPEQLIRPLVFCALIAAGAEFYSGDRHSYAIAAYLLSILIAFAAGARILYRRLGPLIRNRRAEKSTALWIRGIMSLGVLSVLQSFVGNVDIVILGALVEPAEVGVYKVALQGVALVVVFQSGISAVLASHFSRSIAVQDRASMVMTSDKSLLLFSATSLGAVVAIAVGGRWAIEFAFGVSYAGAWIPLLVLGVGQIANALTGPSLTLLIMSSNERKAAASIFIGVIAMAATAVTTVPQLGSVGMAIAIATSVVVSNVLLALAVRKALGFDPTIMGAAARAYARS